jgi:hypothetical protein
MKGIAVMMKMTPAPTNWFIVVHERSNVIENFIQPARFKRGLVSTFMPNGITKCINIAIN